VHCFGGLGRTGVVAACLLLSVDHDMSPAEAIERIRALRGPRAVQTMKQLNFVQEYRRLADLYHRRRRKRLMYYE